MRNTEGYADPTAGRAMNFTERPQTYKTITAPVRKKSKKKPAPKRNIVYYPTPVYVAK